MLRRVLLGLGIVLLAVGAFASWGAAASFWKLREVRVHSQPPARTAREDYASNSYWLEVFVTLNAISGGVLVASGTGVLWLRSRYRL